MTYALMMAKLELKAKSVFSVSELHTETENWLCKDDLEGSFERINRSGAKIYR